MNNSISENDKPKNVQDDDSVQTTSQKENSTEQASHDEEMKADHEASFEAEETPKEKVRIEFPFSDLVREKAPKVFEVAENVATQWRDDEKFDVGLSHPLAEVAAVKALEKAKEVEKKLEEKGVITAAKMGVEIAKIQAQSILSKIKKS